MNPLFIVFLIFCACIGYLVEGTPEGTIIGVAIACGLSILVSFFES